ncbi:ParA family protein [Aurantimonas sp. VKM B-3413]|uniref:ParA family protein n=1 Tax=Aurantimonas sp. VKM B-3413 TaxID=2779401 RepID=UPI001E56F493|nr:ParA family protein [Aurantimonas sp. VKM B-3413]MCB8837911.1 AAA family ATPase [Aurantimonas sp. VKM B-3413]
MTAYAFWNNKGGVGKSYLSFVAACEYAYRNKHVNVYVVDLCPQANVSEIMLGSSETSDNYRKLIPDDGLRQTIGGYIERRLSSPFSPLSSIEEFMCVPNHFNKEIPENIRLIAGDYILEVLSEAMRQASQLSVPLDSWRRVMSWVKDLVDSLRSISKYDDSFFVIDCNPSFSIYTQMALIASDRVIVPFTADDSSRRAIENVFALLYGVGEGKISAYAKISFAEKAIDFGVSLPRIHTIVNNRVSFYEGKPSKAYLAANKRVQDTVDKIYGLNQKPFFDKKLRPSGQFVEVRDYHSAAIVSTLTGTPLHRLRPGPKNVKGERVQLNKGPLDSYKDALEKFVERL